jgi:beta-1,4-mannosyltransferase
MTRVLIPSNSGSNIYVQELVRGYEAMGCSVVFGSGKLMSPGFQPDILHLQWPEEQYRWNGEGTVEARRDRFLARLAELKREGTKIAWTVHNLGPHEYMHDPLDRAVYQKVIDTADLIVHHCPESARLLAGRYQIAEGKPCLLVPHGNYFGYPNTISREEARKRLGVSKDTFVYLSFGAIRGYKGLDTLFEAFRQVNVKNKMLLIAGNYMAITSRGYWYDRLLMVRKQWTVGGRGAKLVLRTIPSDDVQLYFKAADCLVLSHSRGLNSGVAVLGMSFGTTVVGPRLGCIEWVLDQGENMTYALGDVGAFVSAMEAVARRGGEVPNLRNIAASQSWLWSAMAGGVLEMFGIDAQKCE